MLRDALDVADCVSRSTQERAADVRLCSSHFTARDPQSRALQIHAVQHSAQAAERCIAISPHVLHDACRDALCLGVALLTRCQQLLFNRACELEDLHHSTILFSGYSTMPCAFAAF